MIVGHLAGNNINGGSFADSPTGSWRGQPDCAAKDQGRDEDGEIN